MRYSARVDANHADIRDAARRTGYVWVDTYRQGDGAPDAFCLSRSGRWVALEIKSPGGKLTEKELALWAQFGDDTPAAVVYSVDQFLEIMHRYDQ